MTFVANSFAVALASATLVWVGIGLAAPASAAPPEKTFKAAFHYSQTAPASVTYASIKEQARNACLTESRPMASSPMASRARWVQRCQAELVGKAVEAIGKTELTALHDKNRAAGQVAER